MERRPSPIVRQASLVVLVFLAVGTPAAPRAERLSVAIQTLGPVDADLIGVARRAVEAAYSVNRIIELPPEELPAAAYYRPRDRYRAEKLLAFLDDMVMEPPAKIVGLTGRDISTPKGPSEDWGIFGMSFLGGQSCVVSTFRLGRGQAEPALFEQRLQKVVIHELGHALGLPHCSTPRCVMADARGRIATIDGNDGRFCRNCRGRLGELAR